MRADGAGHVCALSAVCGWIHFSNSYNDCTASILSCAGLTGASIKKENFNGVLRTAMPGNDGPEARLHVPAT
jgi:hypothetical protein